MVKSKLLRREEVAEGTWAFSFEKPEGFSFKPGQFVDMVLINPPESDKEGVARSFSIASAPHESELLFATRMRDTAFKRVLKTMPLGTEVQLEGPYGNLTLHNNAARGGVFLAGGIGITPFRSILLEAVNQQKAHRLVLLYANRRPEDACFLEELQALEKRNANFKFVGSMSAMEKSQRAWEGARGHISKDLLVQSASGLPSPIYYVVGPPGMVAAMQTLLGQAGVDDDDIRVEEFGGY